jgi:hypothetical protein
MVLKPKHKGGLAGPFLGFQGPGANLRVGAPLYKFFKHTKSIYKNNNTYLYEEYLEIKRNSIIK